MIAFIIIVLLGYVAAFFLLRQYYRLSKVVIATLSRGETQYYMPNCRTRCSEPDLYLKHHLPSNESRFDYKELLIWRRANG